MIHVGVVIKSMMPGGSGEGSVPPKWCPGGSGEGVRVDDGGGSFRCLFAKNRFMSSAVGRPLAFSCGWSGALFIVKFLLNSFRKSLVSAYLFRLSAMCSQPWSCALWHFFGKYFALYLQALHLILRHASLRFVAVDFVAFDLRFINGKNAALSWKKSLNCCCPRTLACTSLLICFCFLGMACCLHFLTEPRVDWDWGPIVSNWSEEGNSITSCCLPLGLIRSWCKVLLLAPGFDPFLLKGIPKWSNGRKKNHYFSLVKEHYFSLVKDTTAEIIRRQCFSLSPSLSKSMFSIVLFYESEWYDWPK